MGTYEFMAKGNPQNPQIFIDFTMNNNDFTVTRFYKRFTFTSAFAKSCIFPRSKATFNGSIFFSCSKASKSPMVIQASFFANSLAPLAVTPLPTMYDCCSLPRMPTVVLMAFAMASSEKVKWILIKPSSVPVLL